MTNDKPAVADAAVLITTLGRKRAGEIGMMLPHEHVFLDFRKWNEAGYGEARTDDVIAAMTPEIAKARAAGVTAIVETTPVGLGRRPDILQRLSEATGFPLILATGSYGEPWTPPWLHAASEPETIAWMTEELTGTLEGSDTPANWIKLCATDDGMTATETRLLRAAAIAGKQADAAIGSHTVRGAVAHAQLDVLEAHDYPPARFIWFHTNREPDFRLHREAARRGCWIEYDGIGRPAPKGGPDDMYVTLVLRALDAGLRDRLLLSHDTLGYDPATAKIWAPGYNYLSEVFLPKLSAAGVSDDTIRIVTRDNPFRAYATRRGV